MYEIEIERVFNAAHALRLYDGSMEASHRHDWRTFIVVEAEELDAMEVVLDFHELERVVGEVLKELDGKDLNEHKGFKDVNPSAERVAEYIFKQIEPGMDMAKGRARLASVTVTEAPGCRATYRPGPRN